MTIRPVPTASADPDANFSLPAWIYADAEYFAVEAARVMRPSWQIICHVNDIPAVGDWHTLDVMGENIVVVRGEDAVLRAFTNVCRHRGSRLLDGASGCAKKLICPYHAWTYGLDGKLTGVPLKATYPGLRLEDNGLAAAALEIWQGFIFVRLTGDGPSVAEMMSPYDAEVAPYRFADMQPIGALSERPRSVNWKNLCDNYSDNLHIPVAHPGLKRLFGSNYVTKAAEWVDWLGGPLTADGGPESWSERLYRTHLPATPHLPEAKQRDWWYLKLWPNIAFDIYPDQIDFMQFIPVSPTQTLLRGRSYALTDDRREMRAARYLNIRINRDVNAEDTVLVQRVQDGMASSSFSVGHLSETEVCLRSFASKLRRVIPEARLHSPPAPGWSRRHLQAVPAE